MDSFGKRVRDLREAKKLTQHELAKELNTSYAVVGKYERDEMKPSIDVANNIAKALGTTLGYLVGEDEHANILRDPAMVKRINDLYSFSKEEQRMVLYTLDALIRHVKLEKII